MPVAQLITELDPAVFEGLKANDGELCTVEVTTPTGLEDVCAEEVQEKFGMQAWTATGRAFFDVPIQRLPQVLQLRSVENVHVVIHMQPKFPFTSMREECFSKLYALVQGPLWRKGIRAWQTIFGDLEGDPFDVDTPLTKAFQEPNPLLDLRLLKKGSPVALNLPEDVKQLREQQNTSCPTGAGSDGPKHGKSSSCLQHDYVSSAAHSSKSDVSSSVESESTSNSGPAGHSWSSKKRNGVEPLSSYASSIGSSNVSSTLDVDGCVVDSLDKCAINAADTSFSTSTILPKELKPEEDKSTASSCNNLNHSSGLESNNPRLEESLKRGVDQSSVRNGSANQSDGHPVVSKAVEEEDSAPDEVVRQHCTRDDGSGPSFRVCCNRAGTDHVFGSPEAARQLGAAINDRFSWPVRMKHYLVEVNLNITDSECTPRHYLVEVNLNITDNFVYVSLGLTKEPLYRRNLVSFGPTNLRATLCYSLVHLARPRPGDLVLDHMCGGGSITIEGALCFPHCFHVGGELNSKAVDRAATNLKHMEEQKGASLPAGLLKWDATKIPFRDSSVDVVVSDLPFGKRSGSRVDNRTLYLSALQETARIVRPGSGRAVLLTHDRNSMIKNLTLVRKFWRNPSTRTINIGGLYAGVFLLCRTTAKYTNTL
ncbi:THUMP domain [Trinorchestia longiramus]|nr:THUMP domain [Trinorchestia longiramus]